MPDSRKRLPAGFDTLTKNIVAQADTVEGFLYPHEVKFLALLAACPTAQGSILEIGSFKGKSTVVLAKAAALADNAVVNAVDPMTAPSETDPDLKGEKSSLNDFERNIDAQGVAARVRLHQMYSSELAKTWNEPLRLLWIDGDHTYKGTRIDFEGFAPHLVDKAIVAFHDVLHDFDGGIRVFAECVTLSPNFGASGFCGSIAWAQYRANAADALKYRKQKRARYKKLSRLIPYRALPEKLSGFRKQKYQLFKSLIAHGPVAPQTWLDTVD
jgi:predicted O-methyltransferase YrrM